MTNHHKAPGICARNAHRAAEQQLYMREHIHKALLRRSARAFGLAGGASTNAPLGREHECQKSPTPCISHKDRSIVLPANHREQSTVKSKAHPVAAKPASIRKHLAQ